MEKMMYERIIELIEAGSCTDEMLFKLTGVESTRSLTKYWNQIETRELFHVKDGDHHLLVTQAESESMKSGSGAAKSKVKKWTDDPQAKRKMYDTRLTTKIGKVGAAKKKLEGNENDAILKLRLTISTCEYHIANLQRAEFRKEICEELVIDGDYMDGCTDLNDLQEQRKTQYAEANKAKEAEAQAPEGSPVTTE